VVKSGIWLIGLPEVFAIFAGSISLPCGAIMRDGSRLRR
jgi:hypothetical protein